MRLLLKEYENALEDGRKILTTRPEASEGYYFAGASLFALKRFKEAATMFLDGLAFNPYDASLDAMFTESLAMAKVRRKHLEQAACKKKAVGFAKSCRERLANKWNLDERFKPPPPPLKRRMLEKKPVEIQQGET